jgi:hypothetical protein
LARVNSIQIENAGDNGSNKPEFYAPQITNKENEGGGDCIKARQ